MNTILQNLRKYNTHLPEDRLYIHFDKTLYKPGETIWFTVYIRDGQTLKPSIKSEIVTVQLINPKGNIEQTHKIIAHDGVARGDFQLSETDFGGIYKVKTETNWQKNDKNAAIFIKELTVQKVILPRLKMKLDFLKKAYGRGDEVVATIELSDNANNVLQDYAVDFVGSLGGNPFVNGTQKTNENGKAFLKFNLPKDLTTSDGLLNVKINYQDQTESISRSIPIVLNTIKIGFYPEGGDLVNDLYSKVAFKAVNEFGKPADIEGNVLNKNGDIITTFSSFHQGIGTFEFAPEKEENYTVEITKPLGIEEVFSLPQALESGHTLAVERIEEEQIVLNIYSTKKEQLYIVGNIRGKNYYVKNFEPVFSNEEIIVDTSAFPAGVIHFTLFNSEKMECAERLVFVNPRKTLNIKITTDKEKYLPRELVKMNIKVTDDENKPVATNLSISVVDDQLLSFANDKSSNILSWLLMEADINVKVEEPSFYFDQENGKATQALDYLLMTAGWRRFNWTKIKKGNRPKIEFENEIRVFEGKILRRISHDKLKPIKWARVKIGNVERRTNRHGQFRFERINITPDTEMVVKKFNYRTIRHLIHWWKYKDEEYIAETTKRIKLFRILFFILFLPYFLIKHFFYKEKGQILAMAGGMDMNYSDREVEEEVIVDSHVITGELNVIEVNDYRLVKKKKVANDDYVSGENKYYMEREFPKPLYDYSKKVTKRTDFRSTVYWDGNVCIDKTGETNIEFYNSDAVTSFKAITESVSTQGLVGRQEALFYTQLPFSVSTKLPVEVVTGDILKIPLTFINNTSETIIGNFSCVVPKGLLPKTSLPNKIRIKKGEVTTEYFSFDVVQKGKYDKLKFGLEVDGLQDEIEQDLNIVPKGFPIEISFSSSDESQLLKKRFVFPINNPVKGSITANLNVKVAFSEDLVESLKGMIRQPYGCFEQTSSSVYPNILILQLLNTVGGNHADSIQKAKKYIDEGYKRLISFECIDGGFEWFGRSPAHEGLTAYGLMEFIEMQQVYDGVDNEMVQRTANWLLSQSDGKGGFDSKYGGFGGIGNAVKLTTDLYIIWALSESKFQDLDTEIKYAYNVAKNSQNPYLLSLVANSLFNYGWKDKGEDLVKTILRIQEKNGSWECSPSFRSMVGSGGLALQIETGALAILAILKSTNKGHPKLNLAVDFIKNNQSHYGLYGSTNSTILALKALLAFSKNTKQTKYTEVPTMNIAINGRHIKTVSCQQVKKKGLRLNNIAGHLQLGENEIEVEFLKTDKPLAYNIGVDYLTALPEKSPDCAVKLVAQLAKERMIIGETVRLKIYIKNKTNEHQAMTMGIIGLPAGLSLQPWQLKELLENEQVDFYEITGNNLILYYRNMLPLEVKKVNLDLKVEIAGMYNSPASCAYLYYTDEHKDWTILERIEILPQPILLNEQTIEE